MKLTVQMDEESFRLVDGDDNEGSEALYDEVSTLSLKGDIFRATVGDPDDETTIKVVKVCAGGGDEEVEFVVEEVAFSGDDLPEDEDEEEEEDIEADGDDDDDDEEEEDGEEEDEDEEGL